MRAGGNSCWNIIPRCMAIMHGKRAIAIERIDDGTLCPWLGPRLRDEDAIRVVNGTGVVVEELCTQTVHGNSVNGLPIVFHGRTDPTPGFQLTTAAAIPPAFLTLPAGGQND